MQHELIHTETLLEFCPKTSFCILSRGRVVRIGFDEIYFIAKYGAESVIYTATEKIKVYSGLQEILNDLPVNEFFRVSKSHIVSVKKVDAVSGKKMEINGHYIPVTAYYREQMTRRLAQILNRSYEFIIQANHERKFSRTIQSYAAGHAVLQGQGPGPAL